MLGFTPPPSPPGKNATSVERKEYEKNLKREFGWAHITSGGTIANIEALWVARMIKYYPLAIRDVAIKEELDIEIKLPSHTEDTPAVVDIKKIDKRNLLYIKPNESIYLLSRFIDALRKKRDITIKEASKLSSELLKKSKYSLTNNLGKIFTEFPPVIFASGTAHYSIKKAADLLGIGSKNAVSVNMGTDFRLDVADLKKKIDIAVSENKIPLAVIAIAGTTEEGAVDPIHEVLDLRREYEKNNKSFWLHIDSAWGGYISSLFHIDEEELINMKLNKIYLRLTDKLLPESASIYEKLQLIVSNIKEKTTEIKTRGSNKIIESFERKLRDIEHRLSNNTIEPAQFIANLKKLSLKEEIKSHFMFEKEDFEFNIEDRGDLVSEYVKDKVNFSINDNIKEKEISWGGKPLVSSFLAFKFADSITIDPHKLGYVPYPCGVVAFRNDRVRHFIMQRAPYITSVESNILLHNPPQHIEGIDFANIDKPYQEYNTPIDAFAPFILEGSKPGAAAAALWFSSKVIPLNRKNHGLIIKESILAARELHEWIFTWQKIYKESGIQEDLRYEFKTFTRIPNTNVFVFVIKGLANSSLKGMNELTTKVYENFSIQAEQGSKKYSYSQSFFLSKTTMTDEHYKYDVFKKLFKEWGINMNTAKKEYEANGLIVLRATIMNPYIATIRRTTKQNLIRDFVWELHKCANENAARIR